MAKDPAFLFYPGDWMGGTMVMNRHLKGCYIDLLIAQFNNGPLSLEAIKAVLGTDQASWTVLSKKFKEDSKGNFFNERLATEIEKRQKFVSKQSLNGSKGGRPPNKPKNNPWVNPNETLLENENRNRNEINALLWTEVKKNFFQSEAWQMKFMTEKRISFEVLDKNMREFITDIELKEDFKDLAELKRHFTNWYNKKFKNGTLVRNLNGSKNSKSAGAYDLLNEVERDLGIG